MNDVISSRLASENRINKDNQTEGKVEMKTLGTWTGNSEANLTNSIQDMEERISKIEDMVEEMDTSSKENVKYNLKNVQVQNTKETGTL